MNKYALIFITVLLTVLTVSAVSADENITIEDKEVISNYTLELPEKEITADTKITLTDLPKDTSGNISMEVDGVETYNKYVSPIGNQYRIDTSKLKFGTHNATVKYTGNAKYSGFVKNTTFSYLPIVIDAPETVEKGNYGKNSINIYVADGVTGNIKVEIDGKSVFNKPISKNVKEFDYDRYEYYIPIALDSLTFKTHSYKITYSKGNQKSFTKSGKFDVSYYFNVSNEENIIYGDEVNFDIELPDSAKSNIKITLNGKTYTKKADYGYADITLSDFILGKNTVKFTYKDSKYPEKTVIKTVNVEPKITCPSDLTYNTTDYITIDLPKTATGNLTVKINNNNQTVEITNGSASIPINIPALGKYTAEIINDYKNITYTLNITPSLNIPNKIHIKDTYNMTFTAPEYFTGFLKITGFINQNLTLKNGFASLPISINGDGDYPLKIEYIENSTVLYSWNKNITGLDNSPDWNMEVYFPKEIMLDDEITTIHCSEVPYPITGVFTLYIDGEKYSSPEGYEIEDDGFEIDTKKLGLGVHTYNITFAHDDYYIAKNISGSFEIVPLTIEVTELSEDEIEITTPRDDKGTVTVNVDGKKYKTVKITPVGSEEHNYYIVKLNKFTTQNVEVIYSGKYGKITKNFTLTPTYIIGVDILSYMKYAEKDKRAQLVIYDDLTKNIQVSIDSEKFLSISPKKFEDGYYEFTLPDLAPGNHTIEVTYPGDSKYPQKHSKKLLK